MSDGILIGIDAGTSVIKAVAFDLAGRQIAQASCRNIYRTLAGGAVEQDMERTWADTAAVLRELVELLGNDAGRIVGIGVTGQGDGTWLIDADGNPVADSWLWLDARSAAVAAEIAASDAIDTIYRTTGTGVNVCQMRSQLAWMQRHARGMLDSAATAFHCKDWLFFRLTGVRATDPTEGVFTFGDFRSRDYSDDVIKGLGLSEFRHLLPPILDGARETRALSKAAAAATGLKEGLPVSLGYIDIACTALGAGLHDRGAGAGLSILGSTGAHMRLAANAGEVRLNPERTGYTIALPGQAFAQLQTNMAATLNIDWLLSVAAGVLQGNGADRKPADLLASLDRLVMEGKPGSAVFHPYISAAGERGPFIDSLARASLTGLDVTTGWPDIVRAVFDGIVLAARDCYHAMGPMPSEVRLCGGGSRSAALPSLMASALGVPVRSVGQDEAGAAGAVMIAALALGIMPDADTATDAWVSHLLEAPREPDAGLAEVFDSLYETYRATRETMPPVWKSQAAMRKALP